MRIVEIKTLTLERLEKMLNEEQKERILRACNSLENFLDKYKYYAEDSGLPVGHEFVSLDEFIEHMEQEQGIYEEDVEEVEEVKTFEQATEMTTTQNSIMTFDNLRQNRKTKCEIYTNITDKKKLFNRADKLLNECENQIIKVKGVLIKKYIKPMDEPVISEETGEIIKEHEITMATVLVDENGVSYATGSKIFAIQLMSYIEMWGLEDFEEGLQIKIVKNKVKDSNNKSLGFELI